MAAGGAALAILAVAIIGVGLSTGSPGANTDPGGRFGDCTVAVFSGAVTGDGRPIIWKNRDVGNHDQRFIYYSSYQRDGMTTFSFIGDCYRNDTTRIYMGANDRGFAIMNSDSYNLGDSLSRGLDDGTLMRLALETCETLADFEAFLDSTNITGRLDCWNIGCLDAGGLAAVYECANHSYCKYDPLDPGAPTPGYVVRANFSLSGRNENRSGLDRFGRASSLIAVRIGSSAIDPYFITTVLMRDLGNVYDDPYPLPYDRSQLNGPEGYIYNWGCTIANRSTSSAVVIRGVRPGENPSLTTIFAILGPPSLSVAFPLWVDSKAVPLCLSDPMGPLVRVLCLERSRRLYDNPNAGLFLNSHYLVDDDDSGVYSYTLPLEAWGMHEADSLVEVWSASSPNWGEIQLAEFTIGEEIFRGFELETADYIWRPQNESEVPARITLGNYPNPFNEGTNIVYSGADPRYPITFEVYDLLGREAARLQGTGSMAGTVYWAGVGENGKDLSSGIYFYTLTNGSRRVSSKMLLMK